VAAAKRPSSAHALLHWQEDSQLGSQAMETRDVPASATGRDGLYVCGVDSDTILACHELRFGLLNWYMQLAT
jgi:hypothetical protein